jgi:hypothetical protein
MSMSHGHRSAPAGRARASQRTYLVRRVVALLVVLALGWGLFVGFGAVFGSDDPQQAAASQPSIVTVVSDGNPTTAPTVPPTSSTEPPVKERTVPSAADPAELLILGDSDAGSFGPYLQTLLDATGIVSTNLDYKTSSGLARPDFFDWPMYMQQVVPQVNPDIVVVTFGGNDAQGLRNVDKSWAVDHAPASGVDDADWIAEYGKRVGAAMDFLSDGNRTLIWVGIPNDDNPDVTARMQVQDQVVRAEAAKRPKVKFIDTWARFSGRNGGWAEFVIDPRDGIGKDVRADDGFHLNQNGAEILAIDIADAVKADLRDRGAEI